MNYELKEEVHVRRILHIGKVFVTFLLFFVNDVLLVEQMVIVARIFNNFHNFALSLILAHK